MTQWWDDQVKIDGAVASVLFDELDTWLASEFRWASWVGILCQDVPIPGGGVRTEQVEMGGDDPSVYGVMCGPGSWFAHDHCLVTFCAGTLERRSEDHSTQLGYYCPGRGWLCRQCGEAVLKWRETDECRAYMERRARGLPGPPGDG